ncbi:hypothetical protein D3C76_1406110 [compost metagenome]
MFPGQQKFCDLARSGFVIAVDARRHTALFAAIEQHHRNAGGQTLLREIQRQRDRRQHNAIHAVLHDLVKNPVHVAVPVTDKQQQVIVEGIQFLRQRFQHLRVKLIIEIRDHHADDA